MTILSLKSAKTSVFQSHRLLSRVHTFSTVTKGLVKIEYAGHSEAILPLIIPWSQVRMLQGSQNKAAGSEPREVRYFVILWKNLRLKVSKRYQKLCRDI